MSVYRTSAPTERDLFRPMHPAAQPGPQVEPEARERLYTEAELHARLLVRAAEVEASVRCELNTRITELEQAIPCTASLLDGVGEMRRETVERARQDIAELVESLTRRIVGEAIAVDR